MSYDPFICHRLKATIIGYHRFLIHICNDMRTKTTKHVNRIIRVLRLYAVINAYHHYTVMELYRKSLQIEHSWKDAERMSYWMNVLMPYKECSPTDFLRNKDEETDVVLDNYEEFKNWMKIAGAAGVSEKTLTAFSKNVDNLQSVFRLKAFGHIFYPNWLMVLLLYFNNSISKTELKNAFVEYSLFTGKPEPADIAEFRKVVLEIEELIFQIANKQVNRNIKNNTIQNKSNLCPNTKT